MTTEREKIIALAHQHFSLYVRIEMEDERILAFYHAAQAEAFADAVVKCEGRKAFRAGIETQNALDDVIDAIRETIKEKQNATD